MWVQDLHRGGVHHKSERGQAVSECHWTGSGTLTCRKAERMKEAETGDRAEGVGLLNRQQ